MKNSEDNFVDQYIDSLVREEIKIEQEVFYENKSPAEKLSDQISTILSEEMCKAIDKEIISEMIVRLGDNSKLELDFKITPRTKIEFLNIAVDIT